MRCPQCGFHNLPALDRCASCRSVLGVPRELDVHPPRAGRARFLRPVRYWMNRLIGRKPFRSLRAAWSAPDVREGGVLYALASVVPGLGHYLTRRLEDVRLLWPAWFLSLSAGLFFYGSVPAAALVGLAAGLHALIAWDAAGAGRESMGLGSRFGYLLLAFVAAGCLYLCAGAAAGKHATGVHASFALPWEDIQRGDYCLVWRGAYANAPPRGGDVVLWRLRGGMRSGVMVRSGEVLSAVVAEPGDEIVAEDGTLSVLREGHLVGSYRIPWLPSQTRFRCMLRKNTFFCIPPPLGPRTGRLPSGVDMGEALTESGMVTRGDILGRAFMLYSPLRRRGFIRREPQPASRRGPSEATREL